MATNQTKTIDIGRDFSRVPAGRHSADGDYSGEAFREKLLAPALREFTDVRVILDNTEGFGSSFLEEAFGGLVRVSGFTAEFLRKHLTIEAASKPAQRYKKKILQYIDEAERAS